MPFCTNCGTDVRDSKFCTNCGKPIPNQSQTRQDMRYQQPLIPLTSNNPQFQGSLGNQYSQQVPTGYPINYSGPIRKPTGLTLLMVYEVLLGFLLIFVSFELITATNEIKSQLGGSLNGANYQTVFMIAEIIFFIWGILGILSGILVYRWKKSGYYLSYIFLISTGILLFGLYLIPTIVMIAYIYYFNKNLNFKSSFNAMKH